MRKFLFRASILLLLFLLVVLGVAYYQDKKPADVLKQRFGVQNTVTVNTVEDEQKTQDTTETITNIVKEEQENGTDISEVNNSILTEQDQQAAESFIDNLVIN